MSILASIRNLLSAPTPTLSDPPPQDAQPSAESDAPPPTAAPTQEKKNKGTRARVVNRRPTELQTKIINTAQQHPDLSLREIGALADTDHAHVCRTLQIYGIDHEKTENYKSHKADILAGLQHRLLSNITDEELQKSTPYQRIGSAALLMDKERAERGQPGIIIGHGVALSAPLQEAVDRIIERLAPIPVVVEQDNPNDIEDVQGNV